MAAPFGHAFIGALVARRCGVTSRRRLAFAALAGSLPDVDIIAGMLLHGDPLGLHRKSTHTFGFALAAGALAGAAGILGGGHGSDGRRDALRDTLTGAAIVGSHVILDAAPIPKIRIGPTFIEMYAANWVLDIALWGALARALWPRDGYASPAPGARPTAA